MQLDKMMTRRTMILIKSFLLLTLLVASVSISSQAWAQATANFDLGCRAVLGAGGGTIIHGATGSTGALGQYAAGTTVGSQVGVRGGYIQPIPAPRVTVQAIAIAPSTNEQTNSLFMPLLSQVVRIVRTCQY